MNRRLISVIIVVLIILFGAGVAGVRLWYTHNLQPVSTSTQAYQFTVDDGNGVRQISAKLKDAGLIRDSKAFETYARSNGYYKKLQAGTYSLSPSMSVQQIINKMVNGEIAKVLLTILPGQRLDQLQTAFAKAGYSPADIKKAFDPSIYGSHPVLSFLPANASLEGFLYPDSFQKQANTPATTIVRQSLDEMQAHLTASLKTSFTNHGLTVFQAVTLASIIAQESGDSAVQPIIAQVFYSRLAQGMPLGSDVTAAYASHQAGQSLNLTIDSPYNTRVHTGLPPGPISNITASALQAVAQPAQTDYLYFLYGDDNKMHFARTAAEHESNIIKYCAKNCSQ